MSEQVTRHTKDVIQKADGTYLYRMKDTLDELDLGQSSYTTEETILELMKSFEPDYSHLRDFISDFDLKSIQANPLRIRYVANPSVRLCLTAIDLLEDREFYSSTLMELNDSTFLKDLKIVNADNLEEAIIALCNKQRILDGLSNKPELLDILSRLSNNLEFLNKCDSEEKAFKETSNFFDLITHMRQTKGTKV